MNKLSRVSLALLAAALATNVALAKEDNKLNGSMEVTTAHASLSAPYPDAKISSVSALFNLKDDNKLGLSVTSLDAWGEQANYFNVRHLHHLSEDRWLDINAGFSDKGKITAEHRVNAMFNQKFPDIYTILGVGVDYYTMRSGGSGKSVRAQVVKYVPGVPLVLQGGVALSTSSMNDRSGHQISVAATYGRVGDWTITGTASTGRVHYELVTHPGSVADFNSRSTGVGGRYWVGQNWGVSVNLGKVSNRYYTREEIRAGIFVSF